jgi:D-glycero-D-manno-heptose 1,7-bisphosphate phosphatase
VLIENRSDYVKSWNEIRFLPNAFAAMRLLASSEYRVVVVTNQSAVGRGVITRAEADSINLRVLSEVANRGGRIDASYLCPHQPLDCCACRKPAPGLFQQAAGDLHIDLAHSFMIGDAVSDIEAAVGIGVTPLLVLTGRGGEAVAHLSERSYDVTVVGDLAEAVVLILDGKLKSLPDL